MLRALLVEDNAINRKLLRDILDIRFQVVEAISAEEADERLRPDSLPDVIFMDLQLPGMDGLTYIRQLKNDPLTSPIPIVAVSAHAMPADIEQTLAAGCTEYVTKPLTEDPFAFVDRMAQLAESERSQRES